VIVQFCYVRVIELVHNFDFCSDVVEKFLSLERFLFDLFDSVNGSCFFMFGFPYNTVRSLSKIGDVLKIHFV